MKNSTRQTDFLIANTAQRSFAMAVALVFTFICLMQFKLNASRNSHNETHHSTVLFSLISPVKQRLPVLPNTLPISHEKHHQATSIKTTSPSAIIYPVKADPTIATISNEKPFSFDDINDASSAASSTNSKTKFNSTAVRLAYEDSKSEIQKLAETNNKPLQSPKTTKFEKFQTEADKAAKPDCLRQGGSILSLFVIAYQAATDHCK